MRQWSPSHGYRMGRIHLFVDALLPQSLPLFLSCTHSTHQMSQDPYQSQDMIGVHVSDEDSGDVGELQRGLKQSIEGPICAVKHYEVSILNVISW